jgi:type IV pilus assembly protein PilA
MSSIRCPKCNLTNWLQAAVCKRCGAELGSIGASNPQSVDPASFKDRAFERGFVTAGQQTDAYSPNAHAGRSLTLKTGLALASMIIGILSIPMALLLIGIILAPVALVLGIVALVKASRKPWVYGGKGFAITGIVTSAVAMIFIIPLIAAIAIPNLLASKRAANEGSAISTLRTMFSAEATYMATQGAGSCGDLSKLASSGLITPELATGIKNEYQFEVVMAGPRKSCELFATPMSKYGRSFMISQDGVIRGANKKGAKADKNDLPLSN